MGRRRDHSKAATKEAGLVRPQVTDFECCVRLANVELAITISFFE